MKITLVGSLLAVAACSSSTDRSDSDSLVSYDPESRLVSESIPTLSPEERAEALAEQYKGETILVPSVDPNWWHTAATSAYQLEAAMEVFAFAPGDNFAATIEACSSLSGEMVSAPDNALTAEQHDVFARVVKLCSEIDPVTPSAQHLAAGDVLRGEVAEVVSGLALTV